MLEFLLTTITARVAAIMIAMAAHRLVGAVLYFSAKHGLPGAPVMALFEAALPRLAIAAGFCRDSLKENTPGLGDEPLTRHNLADPRRQYVHRGDGAAKKRGASRVNSR
jgi:hypothetical protein